MKREFRSAVLCVSVLCPLTAQSTCIRSVAADRPVSFARDIRPVLSDRCFRCHGPDRITREADLRLDREETVFEDRGDYRIVVPENPSDSELIRRITSNDPDRVMPPPQSGLTLSTDEIDLIRRWVEEGGNWEPHWSYIPPVSAEPPSVHDPSWPRNPIDHFVLARLESEGLSPSQTADRRLLLRRLTLDLTGLPPTPEEIATFLADESPNAYERVVDRLLASARYGEQMALPWLEAARYADTSGYQEDYGRYMYPWRTWVIESFNANQPFDEFVLQQMAGDLLPDARHEQVLATAFHRNHRINQELGAIPEEYLVEYAVDRLETVATVFLGTTIGCARCHDHKYDPFTQREFYELYAFFNNNDDDGLDQTSRFGFCKPFLEHPTPEQQSQLKALESELAALTNDRDATEADRTAFAQWLAQWNEELPIGASPWYLLGGFEHDEATRVTGFETSFFPEPAVDLSQTARGKQWKARSDWSGSSQDIFLGGEFTTHYLFRQFHSERRRQVTFGVGASDSVKVWVNGDLVINRLEAGADTPEADPLMLTMNVGRNEVLVKLSNGGFGQSFVFRSRGHDLVPRDIFAILATPSEDRTPDSNDRLYQYFHETRVAACRQKIEQLKGTFAKVMVMKERTDVRPAHLLERGDYAQPGEIVERSTPAVLPPLPKDVPLNRLGFARWLISSENPLTARVTVNRFWQQYFGRGIVDTPGDFGAQGAWPTHPELLDWLATEFIRTGWDVKQLQRLIVTSATYRQSSAADPGRRRVDPDNRLLSRGPRFRLRPQAIRDQALFVSGLLVERVGGPSVKPYQPDGMWAEVSNLLLVKSWFNTNRFHQDHGDKLYRRSLYTFWKRAVPPPNMTIFDAESREVCTVRRQISNTPLQALNLLNEVTYVEAARRLAERMLIDGGDSPTERIRHGMELVTSRVPSPEELEILLTGLKQQHEYFVQNSSRAMAALSHGESLISHSHDPVELATYMQIALLLLNLDETITRQ